MNRTLSWARVAFPLAVVFGACLLVAQGRHRDRVQDGPWRVVISKPLVGLGWTADKPYSEHEYLTAMFNQLDRDNLQPVLLQIMTEGLTPEDRMLVLCRSK